VYDFASGIPLKSTRKKEADQALPHALCRPVLCRYCNKNVSSAKGGSVSYTSSRDVHHTRLPHESLTKDEPGFRSRDCKADSGADGQHTG